MEITIKWRIAKQIRKDLAEIDEFVSIFGDEEDDRERDKDVDLKTLTHDEVKRLRDVLQTAKIQGTKVLAAELTKYLRAADDGVDGIEARSVRQAAWLIEHFVAELDHHLIFSEDEYRGGSYVGYFVADVRYDPEVRDRGRYKPEEVDITLAHVEDDVCSKHTLSLVASDVIGKTPAQMLRGQGYVAENPTLLATLKRETDLYYAVREKIGTKYLARGLGKVDLDDATESKKQVIFSNARTSTVQLDLFGAQAPVVVDVLRETGDPNNRESSESVSLYRWHKQNLRYFSPNEDELARHLAADEDTEFRPEIQIPVHPLVPCFDLKRHVRLRVHVNNLTQYVYRPEVMTALVIPERDRALIDLLVDQSHNTFQDVISGKGQSMNVLSAGPPGTGKTLSCEVFAEYKQRALYSVQCSQLGVDLAEIEQNLAIILQRANRWNAVLLLDEADVYISKRGTDLQHNAIVGVFLRVLEYAECILFMTTNLPESVDDAIASRCIVKIDYDVPDPKAQAKIWRQLADLNKIGLTDSTINAFVKAHPRISGRDVKNLLKLASFVSARDGKQVDLAALEFALIYKPTANPGRTESS